VEGKQPTITHKKEVNRDNYRWSAVPLMLTRKLRLELGQQLKSNLGVDLVMDIVSHLNKIGGDYFVLNKCVARKKVY
jgi:hypothetical protein